MSEIRATEIMVAAGARELRDSETVVVGIGLPQVACFLAKSTHAPNLTPLLEIGVANMRPIHTPVGLADSRIFYRATCWSGFLDVMGMNLHRGVVDTGFLGALEVDRYGNINTTLSKEEGRLALFQRQRGRQRRRLAREARDRHHAPREAEAAGRGRPSDEPRLCRRQVARGARLTRRRPASHHHRQGGDRFRQGEPFGGAHLLASGGYSGGCVGEHRFPLQVPDKPATTPLPTPRNCAS